MKLKLKIFTKLLFLMVLCLSVSNTVFASTTVTNQVEFSEKEIEEDENNFSELNVFHVDIKLSCDGNGDELVHSILHEIQPNHSLFIDYRIEVLKHIASSTPICFTPSKYILFASILVYS